MEGGTRLMESCLNFKDIRQQVMEDMEDMVPLATMGLETQQVGCIILHHLMDDKQMALNTCDM